MSKFQELAEKKYPHVIAKTAHDLESAEYDNAISDIQREAFISGLSESVNGKLIEALEKIKLISDSFYLNFDDARNINTLSIEALQSIDEGKNDAVEFLEWADEHEFFRLETGLWESSEPSPFSPPLKWTTKQVYKFFKSKQP
jgi:hypothetical protein